MSKELEHLKTAFKAYPHLWEELSLWPSMVELILKAIREAVAEKKTEIKRLRSMALTCCSCMKVLSSLAELKEHITACPEHPIAQYVAEEREECAKIAAGYGDVYNIGFCIACDIRERGKS